MKTDTYHCELLSAIKKRQVNLVKFLLSDGADPHELHYDDRSSLQIAVGTESLEIVKLLIDAGVSTDSHHTYGMKKYYPPLEHAIIRGYLPIVELLLKSGAKTPSRCLTLAVESKNTAIVKALLDHGVKFEKQTKVEESTFTW